MQNSSIDDLCDDKHFSIWAFECMNEGMNFIQWAHYIQEDIIKDFKP